MRNAAMLDDDAYGARRARPTEQRATRSRDPRSMYRALQTLPLARLATNGNEHAHVRAVAILGYN
ncbi:hypothetical protein ACFQ3P_26880 [Paraburkholderia sabiae]|jgi:hypothetical protein|uniref:Uncharacterized protein n=1 Tax=Paraburkholderia sabiae TaxID=273251 RepID=A0ABU9QGJ6_9BURK|nr:hypothetical protein [Paraburkholderia sabiae]WJZ77655.1 hypothetical protein QEN71_37045 [Paraburkholderia sabiae]CAD6555148.1 hypothetical protein LMG24235_05597 [Paraburkholderia sabiae]CAG9233969.1 conserved hypothetical protein [Paraburkholderia sabiae]